MPDAARLRQTPPLLWFLLLVALLCLAVAPHARAQDELSLSVMAGGMASLSTQADVTVEPLAVVSVSAPLADAQRPAFLLVDLMLGALPGAAVDVADPQTFNSLETRVAVAYRPGWVLFSGYVAGGFATRLPADPEPRQRTARWAELGVRLADRVGNAISVGAGYDERLDGSYDPALEISGSVRLPVELGKVNAYLAGRAILGLDFGQSGASRRDVVQLGVCVGSGR